MPLPPRQEFDLEGAADWSATKLAEREAVLTTGGVATDVGTTDGVSYMAANVIT
jgi:hypothetical protein